MSPLQAALYSSTGEAKGQMDLPETLFATPVSRRVLQEAVVVLQGNQRRGTSSTKTRGEVTGGGRKPWKQKGTGNARSGSIRSPLWRKGGTIFGPRPRSYRIELDQAKRALALRTALVEKAKASEISVIESIQLAAPKTRQAVDLLKKAGVSGKTILVVDQIDNTLAKAFGNIHDVQLVDPASMNAWLLMASKRVLFTKSALENAAKRWAQRS
jgi:large subunit ribosomal protein L4